MVAMASTSTGPPLELLRAALVLLNPKATPQRTVSLCQGHPQQCKGRDLQQGQRSRLAPPPPPLPSLPFSPEIAPGMERPISARL